MCSEITCVLNAEGGLIAATNVIHLHMRQIPMRVPCQIPNHIWRCLIYGPLSTLARSRHDRNAVKRVHFTEGT